MRLHISFHPRCIGLPLTLSHVFGETTVVLGKIRGLGYAVVTAFENAIVLQQAYHIAPYLHTLATLAFSTPVPGDTLLPFRFHQGFHETVRPLLIVRLLGAI